MNPEQIRRMREGYGFIAALDQSGGSTPRALKAYGIDENSYANEEEMFDLVHAMRTRIMTAPTFKGEHILGAILFEQTMDREVEGKFTADYLLEKNILPFLKIDKGLAEEKSGVQMMKPMPELDTLLKRAGKRHIFGTKMRSVINQFNEEGIKAIVAQQFEVGKIVLKAGLVPIIEPEVNINAPNKEAIEALLCDEIMAELNKLAQDELVMLKLTLPSKNNLYKAIVEHPNVIRFVALSGGYTQEEANNLLRKNDGIIASFSRALTEGLNAQQTDDEFNQLLATSITAICDASMNKIN